MNEQSITTEIRKFIADKVRNGEIVNVDWVTTEFIARKGEIHGEHFHFFLTCARKVIREIVSRVIGKYDARPITDAQIVLPGFDHLQVAYTVSRGSEVVLVPVDQCSDGELLSRADEFDTMAKGCMKHAAELRQFVRMRPDSERAA